MTPSNTVRLLIARQTQFDTPIRQMGKHVIFLGAGASMGSGYPSADQLRLLLTSKEFISDWLQADMQSGIGMQLSRTIDSTYSDAVQLFRYGAFGTVDEFSSLARRGKFAKFVPDLKALMRVALMLRNPEVHFENSEYYPFLQRLFTPDEAQLRSDVVVISFNYDPYLEYLLSRAYCARRRVDQERGDAGKTILNAIQSGFHCPADYAWTADPKVLKVHGSIAYQNGKNEDTFTYDNLFQVSPTRMIELVHRIGERCIPPVAFPWELFNDQNQFIPFQDFCLNHPETWRTEELYQLFKNIWTEAQRAVRAAEKISFVGISAHPYLEKGFRYMFDKKAKPCEVVVANTENEDEGVIYASPQRQTYSDHSVIGKINAMLQRLQCPISQGIASHMLARPVNSFRDFIWREM